MTKKNNYLPNSPEWDFDTIMVYEKAIQGVSEDFGLDTYPNQIEIITAEQMMDAYASVGMPIGYNHWSFGKQYLSVEQNYKRGYMGLAYEIVINSNPCIAYLMEENSTVMQALVIAHASYGHNSFFKNNYLFKSWTNASGIIDYLLFAKSFISQCEEQHGITAVEEIIDACHALMGCSVDRYKRPAPLTLQEEKLRQQKRAQHQQSLINELWRTLPKAMNTCEIEQKKRFPEEPYENILYFIEKHAPLLETWQREIVRIVRKIAQYFYPQRQTKVMNEGWACFWHYTIINELYHRKQLTDDFMLEFLQHHTSVIFQPPFDSPYFNGINPYTLGFHMMCDIRKICESPDAEDYEWFPDLANTPWKESMHFAMENFKDESFIAQYLSPRIIRRLKLFNLLDDTTKEKYIVQSIHNDSGYQEIRQALSQQNNIGHTEPYIQVYNVDIEGDRTLTLRYTAYDDRLLKGSAQEVLKHVYKLWGFPVKLETQDAVGNVSDVLQCPISEK